MKALIADHVNQKLSLVEREEIPSVDEQDDVIVRIVCAGVCGTDISTLHGKYPGKHGIVNGHEAIGDVVKIGSDVTTLQLGDRVVLQPNSFCDDCEGCDKYKSINSTHCQNWTTFGIHSDGAMAEYAKFNAKYLRKIPDGFKSMNAVLLEPIACVYSGVNKIQSLPREHKVLVMGAGMAGLLWIRVLSHKGFQNITCYCTTELEEKTVMKLGATGILFGHISQLKSEMKFDIIVDCTGAPSVVEWGIDNLARNGTFLLYGVCPEKPLVSFNPYKLWRIEGKIVASCMFDEGKEFDDAIEMAWEMEQKGLINLEDFNVGICSFENSAKGWDEFVQRKFLKLVVKNNDAI